MAKSKTTTKKTEATKQATKANHMPVSSIAAAPSGEKATMPDGSPSGKKRKPASAARRVPVQYTPRIPTARCPGC